MSEARFKGNVARLCTIAPQLFGALVGFRASDAVPVGVAQIWAGGAPRELQHSPDFQGPSASDG